MEVEPTKKDKIYIIETSLTTQKNEGVLYIIDWWELK